MRSCLERRSILTLTLVLFAAAASSVAATVTVNDSGDSSNACATSGTGTCTLRDAITYGNVHAGTTIAFDIAGAGVHTITPASALPAITAAVTIDGYTQPGSSPNTLAAGDNAVLDIQLSGSGPTGGVGLDVTTSNTIIRGLVINGFNSCVRFFTGTATNNTVAGNFLGVDPTGMSAVPTGAGVLIIGQASNTIGGTSPADRNLISGCNPSGVDIASGSGNVVEGNFIGTNASGTAALPNIQGLTINAPGTRIGGTAAGAGNLISGNNEAMLLTSADGSMVEGNLIGTDAAGTGPLPNSFRPVWIDANGIIVGGTTAGSGNVIAFNSDAGVIVAGGTGNTVRGNSIHDNAPLGIDLNGDGVTPNDLGDADSGPNDLQNFPVLSSVSYGASTTVAGLLNSTPGTTFQIDFYSNPACSNFPREFVQGETYLGSTEVTTDGSGNAHFDVTTLPGVPSGSLIAMTATDPAGSTSELSQRLPFSINVPSGSPSGGTAIMISGTNFLPGAAVTIGGVAATGVGVTSYTTMTATTPALAPGTANDLVVTNADGTNGRLVKAFVDDFLDVPDTQQFYAYVTTLVSNAITAGIGDGLYGVNDDTLRQQMSVFILKGRHGLCYTPPACVGVFADVPCPSTFANWIEAMAAEGITGGCGGGKFCPQDPVRRDQMAVFLLKAQHGSSYVPPLCSGLFLDVPCPSTFANWIEQLSHESITGGCGGGNYCPGSSSTRGQMAVFLVKTFSLQ
jgi:IPT/TIG domain/S-layer homology domain